MNNTPGWEIENKLACKHGWEPVLDPKRGHGWCMFKKGDETVWRGSKWIRASKVQDMYANPRKYEALEEALTA